MAKLKATTWRGLNKLLSGKPLYKELTIGNNTTAEYVPSDMTGQRDILIRLHNHPIVRLEPDGGMRDGSGPTNFTLAGYGTVTTRDRVNQFIWNDFSGRNRVFQRDFEQYLNDEPIDVDRWYRLL